MPCSGCSASQASTAEPKPYQPGSISRHCAQLNTQGIARRSSMLAGLLARRRPAADVQRRDLGDDGRVPEIIGEALGLVDQVAIGLEGLRRQLVHRGQIFLARRALPRLQQARLQRRGSEDFQIAAADFGVGIFAGDDLALLGDADLAVHGAAGLREDRLVARPAAAADRAAAAVEQPQPDVVAPNTSTRPISAL